MSYRVQNIQFKIKNLIGYSFFLKEANFIAYHKQFLVACIATSLVLKEKCDKILCVSRVIKRRSKCILQSFIDFYQAIYLSWFHIIKRSGTHSVIMIYFIHQACLLLKEKMKNRCVSGLSRNSLLL